MSSVITYDDIRKFDSEYVYSTNAKKSVANSESMQPGKKKFKSLIKRASKPAPKAQDK